MTTDRPDTVRLSAPILTGGSLERLIVIVPLAAGLLLPTQAGAPNAPEYLDVLATCCLVFAGLMFLHLWGKRRWLEVTLTGFVDRTHFRRAVFRDEDVVGLTVAPTGHEGASVTLEVLGGADGLVPLDYSWRVGEGDPLAALWKRLARSIAARLAERPDSANLSGSGWEVRDGKLLAPPLPAPVPLADIREARLTEHEALLWIGDEANPVRLASGRNALVLCRLARYVRRGTGERGPNPEERLTHPTADELVEREARSP